MNARQLPLDELVAECRVQTSRFLKGEPSQDSYGYELFRRAIVDGDSPAWAALLAEYRALVVAWLRQHPATPRLGEDDDHWVNRAFERFWGAVRADRFADFPGLPAVLRYLKLCVHSVLLDEARARVPRASEALTDEVAATLHAPDPTRRSLGRLTAADLWRAIADEVQDESERLVAHLCLLHELKPREVYDRHPDRFAGVPDVYRVKRNLLDRLRRSPAIQQFLD